VHCNTSRMKDDKGGGQKNKKEVVTGSATYEGETKDGMKHGMGTLTWDDGDQYVGEFKNDEKTNGTFRWKGGDTYTGEWKFSLMHGKGTYTYKNGRMYDGQWVSGYKQGYGVFTWPIGDKYEGFFLKDQCDGPGKMTYADERVYQGQWAQNKKHGYGTMSLANGEKIQGCWANNLLNGTAIFTEANGDRYEEVYKDGVGDTNTRKPLKRKASDIEALLRATGPPDWAPDADFKNCYHCDAPFSLVNRRHHCRHCGLVFCANCTSKKVEIPRMGLNELVRVCDECFLAISTNITVDPTQAPAQ